MSRMNPNDKDNTIAVMCKKKPAVENNETWLRHKADSESGLIDQMVGRGCYNIAQMIELLSQNPALKSKNNTHWEKRIEDHLLHISTVEGDSRNRASGQAGHALPIKRLDGIIKFDF